MSAVKKAKADDVVVAKRLCTRLAAEVSQEYLVPQELIFAKSRGCKRVETARKLIMHRARHTSGLPCAAIAHAMGRDHTRVVRAAREPERALRDYLRRYRMQPMSASEADNYAALTQVVGTDYDSRGAYDAMVAYLRAGGGEWLWEFYCRRVYPNTAKNAALTLPREVRA